MKTENNYSNVKEIIENVKLTEKETALIKLMNEHLKYNYGESYSDLDCEDVCKMLNWNSVKTAKGVVGSLVKKDICTTWDTGTGYDVINFRNQENMHYVSTEEEAVEEPKKEEPVVKTSSANGRKVGDMHSNGKWVWTEYKVGKFDWRVIK